MLDGKLSETALAELAALLKSLPPIPILRVHIPSLLRHLSGDLQRPVCASLHVGAGLARDLQACGTVCARHVAFGCDLSAPHAAPDLGRVLPRTTHVTVSLDCVHDAARAARLLAQIEPLEALRVVANAKDAAPFLAALADAGASVRCLSLNVWSLSRAISDAARAFPLEALELDLIKPVAPASFFRAMVSPHLRELVLCLKAWPLGENYDELGLTVSQLRLDTLRIRVLRGVAPEQIRRFFTHVALSPAIEHVSFSGRHVDALFEAAGALPLPPGARTFHVCDPAGWDGATNFYELPSDDALASVRRELRRTVLARELHELGARVLVAGEELAPSP